MTQGGKTKDLKKLLKIANAREFGGGNYGGFPLFLVISSFSYILFYARNGTSLRGEQELFFKLCGRPVVLTILEDHQPPPVEHSINKSQVINMRVPCI